MKYLGDKQIVEELKRGNTSVFKFLYNDFRKITSFIFLNQGTEEEAKDIFHDALIILYDKIKDNTFVLESKLSTFLYSTCKNLWLNHLRKHKPVIFNRIDIDLGDVQLIDDSKDEKEQSEENEKRIKTIISLLQKLKDPCYSILNMFYFKKLSYRQIAEDLGYQNEKSVKNQKYRCLQKLKDDLDG